MQPLFDHRLLRTRLRRRALINVGEPFLKDIGDEFALRLAPVKRDFGVALNLFPPSEKIGAALAAIPKITGLRTLHINEIADLETLPLAQQSFDLIVSCLGLHYANDLPGVLAQLRRALRPGGLLLGNLIGGGTLIELREAFALAETEITGGVTPRIHPSVDVRQMGALLKRAKFIEPIIDAEKLEFIYAGVPALMKDLRSFSPGNLLIERSRKFTLRTLLARADEIYRERFSAAKDKISARFDLIWFSGWAQN